MCHLPQGWWGDLEVVQVEMGEEGGNVFGVWQNLL